MMTATEKAVAKMKWDPPIEGSDERKEMPRSAFLIPSERSFPYKMKYDGKWVASVKGLRAAISLANMHAHKGVALRAGRMLDRMQADEAEHNDDLDTYLEHHGIMGMRWGIRRKRGPDGRVIPGTKDTERSSQSRQAGKRSPESASAKSLQKKKIGSLTNAELQAVNQRLNLEQQYKNLTKNQKSMGRKAAEKALVGLANQTLKAAQKKYGKQLFDDVLDPVVMATIKKASK